MSHENLPPSPWNNGDQLTETETTLTETQALIDQLAGAWDTFNVTQSVGRPRQGTKRDDLVAKMEALAQKIIPLEKLYESDALKHTNDYLVVLNARQILQYSRDRLGMV